MRSETMFENVAVDEIARAFDAKDATEFERQIKALVPA